ncbi:MAG: TerB family tellurite resistance protein [Polyangiales bacterium]
MLEDLDTDERLQLMKFVCSLAWADLDVNSSEKNLVESMVKRLNLTDAEAALVDQWIQVPPPADDVDPAQVPYAHRKLFLDAVRVTILADGEIDDSELESLLLFEALLQ